MASVVISTVAFDVLHRISGLAINFHPEPALAVAEQLGALRPGGCLGAHVWDCADGMEFLRHFWDVASAIEPGAASMDEARRFPICEPDALEPRFAGGGASRVHVGSISVDTVFPNFEDCWRPFRGGTGPAPSLVATLSEEQRLDLAAQLRIGLGAGESGPIRLRARAWAVCGFAGQ